ncbi:14135_t:CDS:2 [Gigaspora margarita]|uniref:14135_t:CDS:1 n=1 Tax=Gigaspora margarita TaxID=4874 RepID=A0ABM8VX46_GIGMA|nr:14135_t:CDS:2 [Gigaspora margarita]
MIGYTETRIKITLLKLRKLKQEGAQSEIALEDWNFIFIDRVISNKEKRKEICKALSEN